MEHEKAYGSGNLWGATYNAAFSIDTEGPSGRYSNVTRGKRKGTNYIIKVL